jgi:2-methylfumaryl-CoA hydratase
MAETATSKTNRGNFFEDFSIGQVLRHPIGRTLNEGDAALYIALTGERYPLYCDTTYARRFGYRREPLNDLLVFHMVFGQSVADISLNAVANLGYADVRFLKTVYPGETLHAESEVVGLRPTSGGPGIVYVRTRGLDERGRSVLEFYRWVMVNRRDAQAAPIESVVPDLPSEVAPERLVVPAALSLRDFDPALAPGPHFFEDYAVGERIQHADGMTIEESEHALATRLYQNTARVHFDAHAAQDTRFGRRLIYGGHIISLARALSFNGLENALGILAFNAGTHANPTFAGDTIYAWTDVLAKADLPHERRLGALRLRLVATKNVNPMTTETALRVVDQKNGRESYNSAVVLDLDYWISMPRRAARDRADAP